MSYLFTNAQTIEHQKFNHENTKLDSLFVSSHIEHNFQDIKQTNDQHKPQPIKKKKINLELVVSKWFKIGLYSHNNVIPMQLMK